MYTIMNTVSLQELWALIWDRFSTSLLQEDRIEHPTMPVSALLEGITLILQLGVSCKDLCRAGRTKILLKASLMNLVPKVLGNASSM